MLLLQEPPIAALSLSLTQAIVYLLIAIVGGGGLATIVIKLLNRSKDKADTDGQKIKNAEAEIHLSLAELDAAEILKQKVEHLVNESVARMETIQRLGAEKAGAELMVKIKDGQLKDLGDRMSDVLIQVGRFQSGEENCRRDLAAMRTDMAASKKTIGEMQIRIDLLGDHEAILGQNIQMKAILRGLRLNGDWAGNEEAL